MKDDTMSNTAPSVTAISSARDDTWQIEFSDDVTLYCAKSPHRNDTRVDEMIASHETDGDDPEHTQRMQAMIAAVRAHEAQETADHP